MLTKYNGAMSRRARAHRGRAARRETADRLHSAAIHLLRRLRQQDVASGLGPARLSALSVLVFAGPRSLGELAAAEQVRPPTMSRMVAALERRGLARREADPRDRRSIRVFATSKGIRALQRGRNLRVRFLAAQMKGLRREELSVLGRAARLLERLSRS